MENVKFVNNNAVEISNIVFRPTIDADGLLTKLNEYMKIPLVENMIYNCTNFPVDSFASNFMVGFQYRSILKVLRENCETSYMTGSFILWLLNGGPSWVPSDIDIFTTDENFHEKLNKEFNDTVVMNKMATGYYDFVNIDNNKPDIINIYEWKTKCSHNHYPEKLQVIVVKGNVNDVIDKFDFDIIKSKFNGKQFFIPEQTLDCFINNKTTMTSKFGNISELDSTFKRIERYVKREIKVVFPETIEFSHGITYEQLSPSIRKIYHITKDSNILIRNDNNQSDFVENDDISDEESIEQISELNNKIKTYEEIFKDIIEKLSFIESDKIEDLNKKISELEIENTNLKKIKNQIMNICQ